MTFEDAVEILLKHEGGYVNHPRDPGGETNFGISKRSYPALNIAALTREGAIEIYRRDFWELLRIGELPDILRLTFFDSAVNQGPFGAVGMLQAVVGERVDGVMGPITLRRANELDPVAVARKFNTFRFNRYVQSKGFPNFGTGWLKRLVDVAYMTAVGLNGR